MTPPTDPTDDEPLSDDELAAYGYASIPDQLRARDQWVCWRTEDRDGDPTKVPIKPFDSAHPYAKAADPDGDPSVTWGSFAQAVRYYARPGTNTDGIGFVFAPDDVVLGVDFDDVRDPETDAVEPEADRWIDALDSYTEYSPSGTGYHTLLLGILPTDASNRSDLPREHDALADRFEDAPHIEVYDQKRFFTVTGDHVEGTPTELNQRNDVLGDLAREYLTDNRDDGGNASLEDYDGETPDVGVNVTLDDAKLVERAQKAKNGDKFARLYRGDTSGYPSQSEADMAFSMMLAFWTQKDPHQMDSIFRDSGLMRPKWDESRGGKTYGEQTLAKACALQSDVYDPSRKAHDPDDGGDVVAPADPDDDGDETETDGGDRPAGEAAAAGGGGDGGDPPTGDGGGDDDDENGVPKPGAGAGFIERDGCYGAIQTNAEGEQYFDQWTNFEIEVNSFLMVEDTARKYDLTIHPSVGHEEPYDVMAETDDFGDVRRFKETVAAGWSTTFDAGHDALNRIKEFVAAQPARHAHGTHYLGRHGDEYVFPDGTLTTDGWTGDPEHVYVPYGREEDGDGLGEMCTLTPDVGDDPDRDEAARVAELLPELHDQERFLPVLGWFYAVPFRPHIYDWTGQFNFLSITGDTGSGKTRTTGLVNEAFGMDPTPLSAADTTAYSVMVTFASSNAVPVWYDEYKPSDMKDQLVSEFSAAMRSTTTSNSPQRGTKHGGTTSRTLKAPVAIGGEERIQGSAEERRGIFTTYPKGVTSPDSPYRPVYEELKGTVTTSGLDLSQHALAYYQYALSLSDSEVRDLWTQAGEHVAAFCEHHGIAGLEDLVEQGLVTIRFGLMLHARFCEWLGGETPLDASAVQSAMEYVATDSTGGANRQTHVDEFLSLMARAAMAGDLVRDEHYTFVHVESEKPTELRFHPQSTYDLVKRYARDHEATEDLLNSHGDYRGRFEDQLEGDGETYVASVSTPTAPMNKRCDGVYLEQAERTVNGFERSMFDAPDVPGGADGTDTDHDGGGTTPLGAVSPSTTYTDVEVTVASVREPESDAIVQSATVTDETGTLDLLQWDGEPVELREGAVQRLRDVRVTTDDDGAVRLVVAPGVTSTEVVHVDAATDGGAAAESAETDASGDESDTGGGGGSRRRSETDAVSDASDGAYDDTRETVLRTLRDRGPLSEGALVGAAGLPPARTRETLASLVESGRVIQRVDDEKYEVR